MASNRRTRRHVDPRDQAEAMGYDTGSRAIDVVLEAVAIGTRATHPRARRADPLRRVVDCTDAHRTAAALFRQAWEHVQAGRGMGPMDFGTDRVQEAKRGDGMGVHLLPQERALSSAEWHRRGTQAIGAAAVVVHWVVIEGNSLGSYDDARQWRKGRGNMELLAALDRLAVAYNLA
jgi:hypothetical protein